MKSRILVATLLVSSFLSFRVSVACGGDAAVGDTTEHNHSHDCPGSLYDRTIGKVDGFLNWCHSKMVNNPVAVGEERFDSSDKTFPYNRLNRCRARQLTVLAEIAGVTAGAVMAYHNRASLLPYVTWENAANFAGGLYLANKLAPDWLKMFAARIPVVRNLVTEERFNNKHHYRVDDRTKERFDDLSWYRKGASLSPSLAWAEYAAMGGIAYGLRNHISPSNVAKVSLAVGLASLVTPQTIKNVALKIPFVRRLV